MQEKSFTFNYNLKERWIPGKIGNLWVIELKFIVSSCFCLLHQIGNLVMCAKKDCSLFSVLQQLSHTHVAEATILPSNCLLQWYGTPWGQALCQSFSPLYIYNPCPAWGLVCNHTTKEWKKRFLLQADVSLETSESKEFTDSQELAPNSRTKTTLSTKYLEPIYSRAQPCWSVSAKRAIH